MYLRMFDPWKSPMCTCPPKYSLAPYTGCGHACLYCYITSYIPRAFEPRKKKNFIGVLVRDLKRADKNIPISMSNSSDPYTPPEKEYRITRAALKIIISHGFKVLITTKSNLVVRDIDLLKKGGALAMTITTMDDRIARTIEPKAPLPRERAEAVRRVVSSGIGAIIRLDPIIPGVNDDYDSLLAVVKTAEKCGASGITASTFKPRPDSFKRMIRAFPEHEKVWRDLYTQRVGNTLYANKKYRHEIMKIVREICDEHGLTFATCREGFLSLHTAPSCDGTHMLGAKFI
ncbi:MAG: radical SAM protein [Thermoplasmata archaeon]|nr:MAG: radical SAM protein [Thermoplasmata archaeon]